jgi:hypothetical protein
MPCRRPWPTASPTTRWTPNLDDWVAWAYAHGIDERILAFLRFRPDLLFNFDAAHNPVAFPSPRSWEFAHRALRKFGRRPTCSGDALQACVGQACGVELKAFIDNLENLPDIDAILRRRARCDVPKSIDLQYGVAAALVRRAKESAGDTGKLANILKYAARYPQREMGVMLVTDLHRAVGNRLFAAPSSWTGPTAWPS